MGEAEAGQSLVVVEEPGVLRSSNQKLVAISS